MSSTPTKKRKLSEERKANDSTNATDEEAFYFRSYANLEVHRYLLLDQARTNAYASAIAQNTIDFRDKVVLDVGCGTGILSIFCARAGARRVFSVDASDIADLAREVVTHNKLQNIITVYKSRIEELDLPEQVDIIVSEWMGYALTFESMLLSVLFARDKFLKPGGKIFPLAASVYVVPFSDESYFQETVEFWSDDLYGIDFSCLRHHASQTVLREPIIEYLLPHQQLATPTHIATIDCRTATREQGSMYRGRFSTTSMVVANMTGMALWFDVHFIGSTGSVTLSTGPESMCTHWKQTLLLLNEPISVKQDQEISGELEVRPLAGHPRYLEILLTINTNGKEVRKVFEMKV